MTKIYALFAAIIGGLLLFIASPCWLWLLKPETELNVLIVDKTVPDRSYREHKGIAWILNQQKYVKRNGEAYDVRKDYVGFVPTSNGTYDIRPLPSSLRAYDVIYIADTYGVYEEAFLRQRKSGARSAKIYGGMTEEEIKALHGAAMSGGKTFIAEFNSFAHPTSARAREQLETLFHLRWTGWIGRYFPNLQDKEVPVWVKENYRKQYGRRFSFSGPGYVFADDRGRLIVLQGNDIAKGSVVFSLTKNGKKQWNEAIRAPYSYWFDIVVPIDEDEVMATYTLPLTKRGKEKLAAIGLPITFPAVIRHQNRLYESYYFCGDYADQEEVPNIYQAVGVAAWRKWIASRQPNNPSSFYWQAYVPMMTHILHDSKKARKMKAPTPAVETKDGIHIAGKAGRDYLQIYKNGRWIDMVIKGVNIGISKPGAFPGETAITKQEYFRWLQQIAAMNANAVRVYTIHPPAFYEAFYEYNQTAEKPLYLFQGVWLDEEAFMRANDAFHPQNTREFYQEMKRAIDVIHGNAVLPKRPGHASGTYRYDVSPYVLGWIFGVEWDPMVVAATNEKHRGLSDYKGEYIYTKKAEPFEIWLAGVIDKAIAYETKTYHWQRPVSFTNWVTTDLLAHPSEPLKKEDMASVNPNVIKHTKKLYAGLFASYHIYPYYPDFLNLESKYVNYIDHRGEKNNYAGYLHDIKRVHDMPILVAEFGVPSSRGMAHRNVYGMNQGFHSEQEQGRIDRKLFEDIIHEKMAGGLLFIWQDEWFKRTWNTMDYDDSNRRPFWSNAQTNEQQFGLLSFDPGDSIQQMIKVDARAGDWEFLGIKPAFHKGEHALYVISDERYLYVRIDTDRITDGKDTYLLLDTVPNQGQSAILHENNVASEGLDFVLHIQRASDARLWVDSYYDTFYYHYGHVLEMIPRLPYANKKNNGIYHPIRLTLNKKLTAADTRKPVLFDSYETGIMQFGTANPNDADYNSLTDISVSQEKNMYEIRIPWLLLNIKDPSTRTAMGDMWSRQGLSASERISGIRIGLYEREGGKAFSFPAAKGNKIPADQFYLYTWKEWQQPHYHERLKRSYDMMKEAYGKIK